MKRRSSRLCMPTICLALAIAHCPAIAHGLTAYLVRDIFPGESSGNPENLFAFGGSVLFAADDGLSGFELWISDGSVDGTALVENIVPGSGSSQPALITDVNGVAFFQAFDPVTSSIQLWKSASPTAGAELVADLYPGLRVAIESLTNFNGTLFFVQGDDEDLGTNELWKTDGTTGGTQKIDVAPDAQQLVIGEVLAAANRLFFTAATFDGLHWSHELYASDGSAAGTQRVFAVEGLNEFHSEPAIFELTFTGTHLFFNAPQAVDGDGFASNFELFAIAVPEPSLAGVLPIALAALAFRGRARRSSTATKTSLGGGRRDRRYQFLQ